MIDAYRFYFDQQARALGLEPWLLAGLAEVESEGHVFACRFERNFRWLWSNERDSPTDDQAAVSSVAPCSAATELQGQKTSWGLMQVMGATARSLGFSEPFLAALVEPERNIMFGAAFLAKQMARYGGDPTKSVAAYNAGRAVFLPGGALKNQDYVDRVLAAADGWRRRWEGAAGSEDSTKGLVGDDTADAAAPHQTGESREVEVDMALEIKDILQLQSIAFPLIRTFGGPDIAGEFIKPGAGYLADGGELLIQVGEFLKVAGEKLEDGTLTEDELNAVLAEFDDIGPAADALISRFK